MFIEQSQLAEIRERHADEKIVLTSGTFDILHAGHIRALEASRAYGDVMAVMLSGDDRIRYRKGPDRPIIPEADRAYVLSALKVVDYVFLDPNHNEPGKIHPSYAQILSDLRPDFYVADGVEERFAGLETDTQMVVLPREDFQEHELSTSAIIARIQSLRHQP